MTFSFFKNNRADIPLESMSLEQFLFAVRSGHWKTQVEKVRNKRDSTFYKYLKDKLPALTISGDFKTRSKHKPIEKKLKKHSGLICLDVDKKDNPLMRSKDLVDKDCVAQFVSAGGEGIKIIYKCKPVKTEQEHRRIYDAAVQRLEKKGIILKVDPIVKSIASLQYVTYDPEAFININSKVVINPLPPIKHKKEKPSADAKELLSQLEEYVEALGKRDCTRNYEDWLNIMFGISYSIGEAGRPIIHALSKNYKDYSSIECDEKFDSCLEMKQVDNPVTIATVFQIINSHIPKIRAKQLAKKYNVAHAVAVGVGEDVDTEQSDLVGMVRYKLFLFRKMYDKKTKELIEIIPWTINLNAFEQLLKEKGFHRHEKSFVQITNNIVEVVDAPDILRIITDHIQSDGDYRFIYKNMEYFFSWEEIAHRWREIRALGTTANQLWSSLTHWNPSLLKDTAEASYIPYQNGVVKITKKDIKLIPYDKIKSTVNKEIWKERILPRNFVLSKRKGMFEQFFVNVMGRGKTDKEKLKSLHFRRSLWYYGYILITYKKASTARAWLLYDIKPGNNGRSGKTIIGTATGHIRNVTVIDGKQVDLTNRFAFQTVKPWTDIIFIDDPSKFMSIIPFFNMITGQTSADRKGKDPIEKDFKFLIASNWIMEADGLSESGRQFVSQLDDYYNRYSKENGDTLTPIVDVHGKEFFNDWDEKDWSQFDTFSAQAIQFHLKNKPPENTIIGNSSIIRFIQLHEEELFFELCLAVTKGLNENGKEGYINQQLLTSIIRENNESLKANKAGKIAREFLKAIGCKDIHISTMRNAGGKVSMAYRFTGTFKTLDFGPYNDKFKQ